MRRLLISVTAVCLLVLATAAPAFAAQPPRIHDSGTVEYASAYSESCAVTTCSYTSIDVYTFELETGGTETSVCVYTVTYPLRGRGGYTETFGCGTASSFLVAADLSKATLGTTTIAGDTCSRTGCDPTTITVSGTFTATGDASSYSYRSTYRNGDCMERYSVKGASAPASFAGTLDGDAISLADGVIVSETYTFFSTCVYEEPAG
jgi:hypothetical protein